MNNAIFRFQQPQNEPVLGYAPGSTERKELEKELKRQYNTTIEIPLVIGGKEVKTGKLGKVVMPTEHGHVLATYHQCTAKEVKAAVDAALSARKEWAAVRIPCTLYITITRKGCKPDIFQPHPIRVGSRPTLFGGL